MIDNESMFTEAYSSYTEHVIGYGTETLAFFA